MNNITIINIGNELLSGKTLNTSLPFIADKLLKIGFEVSKSHIVPDEIDCIVDTICNAWKESLIIIITGGLGPTQDDITRYAVAKFFQKKLIFNEEVYDDIKKRNFSYKKKLPEINRVQALIPEGFTVLSNMLGTAPGLMYEEKERTLFCLQGVPIEMQSMTEKYVIPYIKNKYLRSDFFSCDLNTYGISESKISELLLDIVPIENTKIAWLPQTGRVDLRIFGSNISQCEYQTKEIKRRLKKYIWGINQVSPSCYIHNLLIKNKMTISCAESCTGGMLTSLLTENAGSSSYLKGSIIAYSNQAKINLLGVPIEILNKHGAVSKETAHEMLLGSEKIFKTDIVCSITGIAGPTGGNIKKPIGTVYIGVMIKDKIIIEKNFFKGNRHQIRLKSTEKLMMILINQLDKYSKL